MVRKLTLVGLLVVVGRGTVAQLFVAVCISCMRLVDVTSPPGAVQALVRTLLIPVKLHFHRVG